MKASTRLDSVVFHLTPTRTRFDLILHANGKTENITSGLVNPFLAHLKTAQDQVLEGSYKVILRPQHLNTAAWFTKETVERFVRFVSTPEILERVQTLESEILQLEETLILQNNCHKAEDQEEKCFGHTEGITGSQNHNEKAIVLYKPSEAQVILNGKVEKGRSSKVHIVNVLEARRTVLQKEQGMAFARAVAAGYDMENMLPLVSFGQHFGAYRLIDACMGFMDLWKTKHETGQWIEIEAAEKITRKNKLFTECSTTASPHCNKQEKEVSESCKEAEHPMNEVHPLPGSICGCNQQPLQCSHCSAFDYTGANATQIMDVKAEDFSNANDERLKKGFPQGHNFTSTSCRSLVRNIDCTCSTKQCACSYETTDANLCALMSNVALGPGKKEQGHTHNMDTTVACEEQWHALQQYLLDSNKLALHQAVFSTETGQMNRSAKGNNNVGKIGSKFGTSIDDPLVAGRKDANYDQGNPPSGFLMENEFEVENVLFNSSHCSSDDSYIVPVRSSSLDHCGHKQTNCFVEPDAQMMDLSSITASETNARQARDEPYDLKLLPDRSPENYFKGYDPALDFGTANYPPSFASTDLSKSEALAKKQGKLKKSHHAPSSSDRMKMSGLMKKIKPSRESLLDEAKARAQMLRKFKADMQKMKQEKQEEELRRVSSLRSERHKKTATRSNSVPPHSPGYQSRKQASKSVSPLPRRRLKHNDCSPQSSTSTRSSRVLAVPANRMIPSTRKVVCKENTVHHLGPSLQGNTKAGNGRKDSPGSSVNDLSLIPDQHRSRVSSHTEQKMTSECRGKEMLAMSSDDEKKMGVANGQEKIVHNSAADETILPASGANKESGGDVHVSEKRCILEACSTGDKETKEKELVDGTGVAVISSLSIAASTNNGEKESALPQSTCTASEQLSAPIAHTPSPEHQSFGSSSDNRASANKSALNSRSLKDYVHDVKGSKMVEASNHQSKGFRWLAKFGRKSTISRDTKAHYLHDGRAVDDDSADVASSSSGSRHFSLLSFRSKSDGKKLSTR